MILKINSSEAKRRNRLLEEEKKKLGLESKVNLKFLRWDNIKKIPVYESEEDQIKEENFLRFPRVSKIEENEYLIAIPLEKVTTYKKFNKIIKHELYHIYAKHLDKKITPLANTFEDIPADLYANFGINCAKLFQRNLIKFWHNNL